MKTEGDNKTRSEKDKDRNGLTGGGAAAGGPRSAARDDRVGARGRRGRAEESARASERRGDAKNREKKINRGPSHALVYVRRPIPSSAR